MSQTAAHFQHLKKLAPLVFISSPHRQIFAGLHRHLQSGAAHGEEKTALTGRELRIVGCEQLSYYQLRSKWSAMYLDNHGQ